MNNGPDHSEAPPPPLVATFYLWQRLYGIATEQVQEVVRIPEITPVHHAPEQVLGIMNLRGRIVTVLDLGFVMGFQKLERTSLSRIFILQWATEFVGLLVDQVADVVQLETDEPAPVPENIRTEFGDMLRGVFHFGGALVGLLNVEAIMREDEPHGRGNPPKTPGGLAAPGNALRDRQNGF